jgi:hypothetical protein
LSGGNVSRILWCWLTDEAIDEVDLAIALPY